MKIALEIAQNWRWLRLRGPAHCHNPPPTAHRPWDVRANLMKLPHTLHTCTPAHPLPHSHSHSGKHSSMLELQAFLWHTLRRINFWAGSGSGSPEHLEWVVWQLIKRRCLTTIKRAFHTLLISPPGLGDFRLFNFAPASSSRALPRNRKEAIND